MNESRADVRWSGFTLWFTGLSGAGKSTLARAVEGILRARGRPVEVVDGDEIRRIFGGDLGYAPADRATNMRRMGYLAQLLSRNGVVAIVAAMSPYRDVRQEIRGSHRVPFIEVFVDCPIDQLMRRDTKGLYAGAQRGETKHVVGVSDAYETSAAPDISLRTDLASIEACVAEIIATLERKGLVAPMVEGQIPT